MQGSSDDAPPISVTVVGTGTMGSAIVRALLAGGSAVTAWNRTAARADALRADGASVAADLAEAVRASAVTIMCVADQAAVGELLGMPGVLDALAGRTLVQLTTGTGSDGRRNASVASERSIEYLDGAIMAYPRTIGTDAGVILYAGSSETFATARALLAQLGTARYVGEDAGRPAILDAALISFSHAALAGLLHGAILADAENIEIGGFFDLVGPWFDGFITDAVRETMERISVGEYGDAQSSMKMHLGGLDLLVVGVSREAGIDHGVMTEIRDLFAKAVTAGRGDEDIAVLFDVARAARTSG